MGNEKQASFILPHQIEQSRSCLGIEGKNENIKNKRKRQAKKYNNKNTHSAYYVFYLVRDLFCINSYFKMKF